MKIALALATVLAASACGGEESSSVGSLLREPGECGEVETHVIGLDDGNSSNGEDQPTVVTVARPGRHVIVLSGRDQIFWEVRAENGAEIEKIYTFGGGHQYVSAPRGIEVVNETEADGGAFACGYSWPPTADCDTAVLLKLASLQTKKHPNTFHGCKSASFFRIGENLLTTSDCQESTELAGAKQSDLVTLCQAEDDDPTNDCDDVTQYYER